MIQVSKLVVNALAIHCAFLNHVNRIIIDEVIVPLRNEVVGLFVGSHVASKKNYFVDLYAYHIPPSNTCCIQALCK